MHQYDNMIRTQFTATCEQQVEFVQPTLGLCAATCFKRKDNKKVRERQLMHICINIKYNIIMLLFLLKLPE